MSKKNKKKRRAKWEDVSMDFDFEAIPPVRKKSDKYMNTIPKVGVAYIKADGTRVELKVYGYEGTWERLLRDPTQYIRLEKAEDGTTWLIMTVEKAQYYTSQWEEQQACKPRPLMCVFDATKKYCQQMFGITLDKYDEDYFIAHPLVVKDGVPMAHTMQVVQELVQPYGLRVCRVRVASGKSLLGSDFAVWEKALGVNPLGGMDHHTTNAEWLVQSPKDTTDYRFEYSNEPLRPSVSCGVYSHGSGYETGFTGGHARYVAPRDDVAGAMLSLQIQRAEHTPWRCEVPMGPLFIDALLEAGPPPKTFEGFDLSEWAKDNPFKPEPVVRKAGDFKSSSVVDAQSSSMRVCGVCQKVMPYLFNGPPRICHDCWEKGLAEISCTSDVCKSNAATGTNMLPFYYTRWDYNERRLVVKCRNCQREYGITATTGSDASTIRQIWTAVNTWYNPPDHDRLEDLAS